MARQRRSASEARERILEHALRRVREAGPDALTLKALARDLGVSHPAILHHFGSREALMESVVREAIERLQQEILAGYARAGARVAEAGLDAAGPPTELILGFLERAGGLLVDEERGRLFGWLSLSRRVGGEEDLEIGTPLAELATVARANADPALVEQLDEDEVLFGFVLSALAVLGESVFGRFVFRAAGLDPVADRPRFRAWLARKLMRVTDPE
ncbi:MAG: TetR/AcrR family transcriptional regulator [Myxococcota bacterium]